MVKKIVKGKHIFARKAQPATEADRQVVTDLIDTLRANREICVGMAANMIGVNKSIIVVASGPFQFAMINPVIIKKYVAHLLEEAQDYFQNGLQEVQQTKNKIDGLKK